VSSRRGFCDRHDFVEESLTSKLDAKMKPGKSREQAPRLAKCPGREREAVEPPFGQAKSLVEGAERT